MAKSTFHLLYLVGTQKTKTMQALFSSLFLWKSDKESSKASLNSMTIKVFSNPDNSDKVKQPTEEDRSMDYAEAAQGLYSEPKWKPCGLQRKEGKHLSQGSHSGYCKCKTCYFYFLVIVNKKKEKIPEELKGENGEKGGHFRINYCKTLNMGTHLIFVNNWGLRFNSVLAIYC